MAIAIKQIMLITRNVQFAIDVKRALEALGEYSVTTVADLRNAMETLRESAHHLVLLDTNDLSLAPEIMIEMIRSRQAEVAIVLAPDSESARDAARRFGLQGVIDIPVMARRLLPILDQAMEAVHADLPVPNEADPVPSEDTVTIESLVGDAWQDEPGLNYTRRRLQASLDLLNPPNDGPKQEALELRAEPNEESDTVRFRYISGDGDSTLLASMEASLEETPLAAGLPGGTVKELAQSLAAGAPGDAQSRSAPKSEPAPSAAGDIDDSAAFRGLLDCVLDESTAIENLTLESLFDTTRELPGALGAGAVPAWLRETEKFIQEPSFLPKPESLPALPAEPIAETTVPADIESESTRSVMDANAMPAKPNTPRQDADQPGAYETPPDWMPLSSRESDPLLAQLALTMTRAMSDLTADATVLTRGKRIVGFSGDVSPGNFRALRRAIADDWLASQAESRIRFVKLPDGKAEYMLCTRDTVGGHCLTLVFAGDKALGDIRAQGDRMLRALKAVRASDSAADADDETPQRAAEADAMQPFAFVWMLADPALALNKWLAEQLVFWLEVQLNSLNWRVHRLDVHQDFIYLRADAPSRASPDSLARAVMERSRNIACSEDRALPSDLWADAYLVLQPGRDMDERELREFLQFARA